MQINFFITLTAKVLYFIRVCIAENAQFHASLLTILHLLLRTETYTIRSTHIRYIKLFISLKLTLRNVQNTTYIHSYHKHWFWQEIHTHVTFTHFRSSYVNK